MLHEKTAIGGSEKAQARVWTSSDNPKGTFLNGESAPSGGITLYKKTKQNQKKDLHLVRWNDREKGNCFLVIISAASKAWGKKVIVLELTQY